MISPKTWNIGKLLPLIQIPLYLWLFFFAETSRKFLFITYVNTSIFKEQSLKNADKVLVGLKEQQRGNILSLDDGDSFWLIFNENTLLLYS